MLPAGAGCKELFKRAVAEAKGNDPFPFVSQYFQTVAMGKVAKSAEQAREITAPILKRTYEIVGMVA